jgi:hypothetical protein
MYSSVVQIPRLSIGGLNSASILTLAFFEHFGFEGSPAKCENRD